MDDAHLSPAESSPEISEQPSPSTFECAFNEYCKNLPDHKKKFLDLCRTTTITGENVSQIIIKLWETKAPRRLLNGPAQKNFIRFVNMLKTYYDGVITPLVSLHANPCSIVWGAVKAVIEASNRHISLFESIQNQLEKLTERLKTINEYQDLYGDSERMQRLVCDSYIKIIEFWYRVHKECQRKALSMVGQALTGTALYKINSIISDITSISGEIFEYSLLCQGRKHKQARDLDLCTRVRNHLTDNVIESGNRLRHQKNRDRLGDLKTCEWLKQDSCYSTWCDPTSEARRFFCLSGPPGHGKSTLTSFAIHDLESKGAAVAYYFCQFSQPCEHPTDILRLLLLQLFNVCFKREMNLDEKLARTIHESHDRQHYEDCINVFVKKLVSEGPGEVYFFIDGLDEAKPECMKIVLGFLKGLLDKWAGKKVGLWVSKQRQARVVEWMRPDPGITLELVHHTENGVKLFLKAKLDDLERRLRSQDDFDEADNNSFLQAEHRLMSNAQGNFMWAWLMTQRFEEVNRVEDVHRILDEMPKELADVYKGFFDRFAKRLGRDSKRMAMKVMSLVAFAHRHLRLEELQEAATLVSHEKKQKGASNTRTPLPITFLGWYTILVEVDGDPSNPTPTDTCHLVHSSVLEFLKENPAILSEDQQPHFSHFPIADACLMCLTHPDYANGLPKQSQPDGAYTWKIADMPVFSQYAAKYWVRHLDDLDEEDQDRMRERVKNFVSSNNFQTCMQIQSIWVQGQFNLYSVQGKRNLRCGLPRGIPKLLTDPGHVSDSERRTMSKHQLDYQELMHDWRMLLSCGDCSHSDEAGSYSMFRGELDRIWWKALGPDHLFSNFQSRHISFSLSEKTFSERFEALSVSKEQIVAVRLENWDHAKGSLQFVCEHWTSFDHVSAPTLGKKQIITTTEAATNWLLYVEPQGLRARPTALSGNAQILRLGAQLFMKDKDNEYHAASGGGTPSYFEEVSGRGALVVIGRRLHTFAARLRKPKPCRLFERDSTHLERLEDSDTDERDDEWLSEASASDSSEIEMECYESWSETSTDEEGYVSSSSEPEPEPESEEARDPDESMSTGSAESDLVGTDSASGRDTPEFPSPSGSQDSVAEEESWGRYIDARLGIKFGGHPLGQTYDDARVVLTVLQYDDNSIPIKLFKHWCPCPLSSMLYDSPPAVHPQEPLVVWPLGGGDLLFADVAGNTSYTRQLRPSAPRARHIQIKLQFSPCAHFLHVASLEVQLTGGRNIKDGGYDLCMLVFTYRLSTRKPTRSPPICIHRVEVKLGKHEGQLNVSHLHFVFNWTPRYLFLSRQGTRLQVSRIKLFKTCASDGSLSEQDMVPRKTTLLPDSAALRDVYFVPLSDDPNGASMVVVGSKAQVNTEALMKVLESLGNETSDELASLGEPNETSEAIMEPIKFAPSVGAILQAGDIGGWTPAQDKKVPQGHSRNGDLEMRKEKFHPVEDCDVEPYPVFL